MKNILFFSLLLLSFTAEGQYTYIVAGHHGSGYGGDGGPATAADLYNTFDLALSKAGNLYIADNANHVIRKVDAAGIITTVAGNHIMGYSGDGGPATAASLFFPQGIAVDSIENLYIVDENNVIRKVNSSGIISTIAGGGTSTADGVPATDALLDNPVSVAIDIHGNIYTTDGRTVALIKKIDTAGIITTYAGTAIGGFSGDGGPATAASLNAPRALRLDAHGNLYFVDNGNMRVRKIDSSGIITTIAGNGYLIGPGTGAYFGDGGPATDAALNNPLGLALDKLGNIYISDAENNVVRRVDTTGTIITALGIYSVDVPFGLAVDTANNLYVGNDREVTVRKFPIHCMPTGITAIDSICTGSSIIASNSILGGMWSVKNSHATITSWGRVTGITAGIDTIMYTTNNTCGVDTVIRRITIVAPSFAGPVTGVDSVCAGATVILTDGVPGGIWTASNSNASVSGGIVLGISIGLDTISYTLTTVCGTSISSKVIMVDSTAPMAPIIGATALCVGASVTLSDSTAGGTWSTSNSAATVFGGIVTGINAGTDSINYTLINGCGASVVAQVVTVNEAPTTAGTITGSPTVCIGNDIILIDGITGGTWSTSNPSALITVAGVLTGVTAGSDTIFYTVTNFCGSDSTSLPIVVLTTSECDSIAGVISLPITETINLFPNPVQNKLTITFTNTILNVKISNTLGQLEYNHDFKNNSAEINVAELPSGLHFVTINDSYQRQVIKE